MILPFIHKGMETMNPRGSAVPRPMQSVSATFGEPVLVEDIWQAWRGGEMADEECYQAIANRVQIALVMLKVPPIPLYQFLPSVLCGDDMSAR